MRFLLRWVEADFWWSDKVWSRSVFCGVWHPLHKSALLCLQTVTTVRSCYRTRRRLMPTQCGMAVSNTHSQSSTPDKPTNDWSCWREVMVIMIFNFLLDMLQQSSPEQVWFVSSCSELSLRPSKISQDQYFPFLPLYEYSGWLEEKLM